MVVAACALSFVALGLAGEWRVAYTNGGSVWTVSPTGAGARRIVDGLQYDRPVTASPDGKTLIYWSHAQGHWDLWSCAPDGSNRENLTADLGGGCRSAVFSPDGRRIAFMCDGPEGLYVMDRDGAGKRRLTALGHRDDPPAWSPDGRQLAYTTLADPPAPNLYVVQTAGGAPQPIGRGRGPIWLDSGRVLVGTGSKLIAHNLAAASQTVVWTGEGTERVAPIAVLGKGRYAIVSFGPDTLSVLSPSGKAMQRSTVGKLTSNAFGLSAAPDGSQIAVFGAGLLKVIAGSRETVLLRGEVGGLCWVKSPL